MSSVGRTLGPFCVHILFFLRGHTVGNVWRTLVWPQESQVHSPDSYTEQAEGETCAVTRALKTHANERSHYNSACFSMFDKFQDKFLYHFQYIGKVE